MILNRIHKYLQSGRAWYQRPTSQITKITVHHSAIDHDLSLTGEKLLENIKNVHSGKGWPGLSYHYVIDVDGKTYQTNKHEDITWHDGVNKDSIGVLVTGWFHPSDNNKAGNDKPTLPQLKSLKELLDKLCTKHPEFPADQDDVVGHRERSATVCPGDYLMPYVLDYRKNLGNVNWVESGEPEDKVDVEKLLNTLIPIKNFEGKEKTVRFYFDEWEVEKLQKIELEKDFDKKINEARQDFEDQLSKGNIECDKKVQNEVSKVVEKYKELAKKDTLAYKELEKQYNSLIDEKNALRDEIKSNQLTIKDLELKLKLCRENRVENMPVGDLVGMTFTKLILKIKSLLNS